MSNILLALLFAGLSISPAMAQYRYQYQPQPVPDLARGYQQGLQSIAPPSQPTFSVQPAPMGGYTVQQTPSYGNRNVTCRPGPMGGYGCQ